MSDLLEFIPGIDRVTAATSYPKPYEFAWEAANAGRSLTEAIDSVRRTLGVGYDLASSLVWAEMSVGAPRLPS